MVRVRSPVRVLLAVEVEHPRAAQAGRVLRTAARDYARALKLDGRELSLSLVSDRRIRALNRKWRGHDRATDVLSFPLGESPRARGSGPVGDVVISLPTALRQAGEGGWSLARELRRLLAHGLLHCLGHDHGTRAQALRMDRAERRLLGREGMVGASLVMLPKSTRSSMGSVVSHQRRPSCSRARLKRRRSFG
jgi:probable rRNA maturation factor